MHLSLIVHFSKNKPLVYFKKLLLFLFIMLIIYQIYFEILLN